VNNSGPDGIDGKGNLFYVRLDNGPIHRGENQRGKGPAFKALLALHIFIAGNEDVKRFLLDQREQRAVLMPPHSVDTTA